MLPDDIVRAAILLAAVKRRPPHAPRNAPMTRLPRLDGPAEKPVIGGGVPQYPFLWHGRYTRPARRS